jgi:hypothetical protein
MSEGLSLGDPVLEGIIRDMREILGRLRIVATGDIVKPEDHNDLVEFATKTLELASRLAVSGLLPPWVPILDVGKLDYMIVGEPRRSFAGAPPGFQYWERKPIYGYLYESDINMVVAELNLLLNEEVLASHVFGERFTSDKFNTILETLDYVATRAGLPARLAIVDSDAPPRTVASLSVGVRGSHFSATLMSVSLNVEVR